MRLFLTMRQQHLGTDLFRDGEHRAGNQNDGIAIGKAIWGVMGVE